MNEEITSVSEDASRCGYVAIVGRPNVGKSTLLNRILGQKISITTRKPQTTRHQIIGIKTEQGNQTIYVDTPGLHKDRKEALNRYMNRAASSALRDVDVVIFVTDRTAWTDEDELVLSKVIQVKCPVILAINKMDKLKEKETLLPYIQTASKHMSFAEIVPISAGNGDGVDALEKAIVARLPSGIHFYPEDQITDRSERFLASEVIREKIMRRLGDEIPYQVTVEIEEFNAEGKLLRISALIHVQRAGQKRIIIGNKGEQLKAIGSDARIEMERLFQSKIMLTLWVKVKSGWSDDERALKSLGYEDR